MSCSRLFLGGLLSSRARLRFTGWVHFAIKENAGSPGPESSRAGAGRWSAKRKGSVVLELLRGADLESTSRKYRVTAATLIEWRDRFLAGGEGSLKSREVDVEDEERRRLKSVVASVSVENELLREKIARMENGRPLAFWKSKP